MTVPELDKYIDHHQLNKKGKKVDKIRRITVHHYGTSSGSSRPSSVTIAEDSEESDSDNDLILCDDSESDSESDCESDDEESHPVTIAESTSRSGRRVGHWSTRYADFVQ